MLLSQMGYEITEEVHSGTKTSVYMGKRISDNLSVMLKVLKSDHPNQKDLFKLKHEYEITTGLNIDGIIKAYAIERYNNHYVLVLEDIQGESLKI